MSERTPSSQEPTTESFAKTMLLASVRWAARRIHAVAERRGRKAAARDSRLRAMMTVVTDSAQTLGGVTGSEVTAVIEAENSPFHSDLPHSTHNNWVGEQLDRPNVV